MGQELIKEEPIFEDILVEEITEDEDDGLSLLKITGTASRGDIYNKNNRMYPTKVLKKVAEKVQPVIKKGKLTGMLDHPSFFDNGGLKGTAIKFTKMWLDNNDLKFEGNVIPTTQGKELAVLLKSKVGIGVSTRGYGTMLPKKDKKGKEDYSKMIVQDDYELLGVDAVSHEANQYGKIAKFEHKEGGTNVDELTMDTLKENHPELVEALKKELAEEVNKNFDGKVSAEVEKQVSEQKEIIRKEAMESDEVKGMQAFINTVVEAAKPLMPGQKEYVESEKQKEVDDLTAKLADAEKAKEAAVQEAANLKAEKEQAEAQKKVKEHIEAKVQGHRFAEQLKNRLSECASVEEVDAKFAAEEAFINELVKPKEDPKGLGESHTDPQDDSTTPTPQNEEIERQRRLAGIPTKTEGGK